jgi:hypothetical protein
MAGRIGEGAPVTGDEVRDMWFMHGGGGYADGYLASEVDGLLRRVAAELDAGRPAGPLIENTAFRTRKQKQTTYDIEAVDWFLEQLLPQDHCEPPGTSADPWRDGADVAQLVRSGVSGLAQHYPRSTPGARNTRAWFAGQCQNAWRGFGQVPGTRLWWGRPVGPAFGELRTADQQTLASLEYGWQLPARLTVTVPGGRTFRYTGTGVRRRSTADSWPPGVADIAARTGWDEAGHFAAATVKDSELRAVARGVHQLVDETGTPILYTSGRNFDHRACACVTFPGGRWLRFPVRGTKRANAIMTAVDQAGNKVARYRINTEGRDYVETMDYSSRTSVEITVNPGQELTDELVLAIALSGGWPSSYFAVPS